MILNEAGHTLLWQLDGTSRIEIKDGGSRTVTADETIMLQRDREFLFTREDGARVVEIVMGTVQQ